MVIWGRSGGLILWNICQEYKFLHDSRITSHAQNFTKICRLTVPIQYLCNVFSVPEIQTACCPSSHVSYWSKIRKMCTISMETITVSEQCGSATSTVCFTVTVVPQDVSQTFDISYCFHLSHYNNSCPNKMNDFMTDSARHEWFLQQRSLSRGYSKFTVLSRPVRLSHNRAHKMKCSNHVVHAIGIIHN